MSSHKWFPGILSTILLSKFGSKGHIFGFDWGSYQIGINNELGISENGLDGG
jgi:hypothetical protein